MPETPQGQKILDQYELGDTAHDPEVDEPTVSRAATQPPPTAPEGEATSPPPEAPSRPRNPDGTFAPDSTAPPQHSRRARRMAADLGLPQSEIDSMTPEALEEAVYWLNRQAIQDAREASKNNTFLQGQERKPEPANPPAPEVEEDWSDFDPRLANMAKEIKELKAQVTRQSVAEAQRAKETLVQYIDRVFAEHGDPELFGKERTSQDTPEFQRRMAAVSMAERMPGKEPFGDKLIKAIQTLYGARKPAEPERKPMLNEDAWRNGGLARPTQRAGAGEPPGDKKSRATAARIMREQGLLDDDDTPIESFPE